MFRSNFFSRMAHRMSLCRYTLKDTLASRRISKFTYIIFIDVMSCSFQWSTYLCKVSSCDFKHYRPFMMKDHKRKVHPGQNDAGTEKVPLDESEPKIQVRKLKFEIERCASNKIFHANSSQTVTYSLYSYLAAFHHNIRWERARIEMKEDERETKENWYTIVVATMSHFCFPCLCASV